MTVNAKLLADKIEHSQFSIACSSEELAFIVQMLRGEATQITRKLEDLAMAAGIGLSLRQRAERFLRTSAPHHRDREWYKIIDLLLAERSTSERNGN